MVETKSEENLEKLLKLRLIVAALGERQRWWTSTCCDPTRFIAFRTLFPKTWRLAAFCAVSEAAKRVHQDALTNRSQHLFRFQTEIEQDLRRCLTRKEGQKIFDETLATKDEQKLLAALQELAAKGVHARAGAVKMGQAQPDNVYENIPKIAGLYLAAFRNNVTTFPYFSPEDEA